MKKAIGIDLGGTYIKGALIDEQGNILVKEQISTLKELGADDILRRIAELTRQLAQMGEVPMSDLLGVGIGIPGFIDERQGMAVEVINIGWKKILVREPLERMIHLPVFMENDANSAALGEAWVGAGRGTASAICVTLGTGVGGGIVLNQKIWSGSNHMGGELGHFVMDPEGAPCNCGRRGCLETFSSATGILRMARDGIESGVTTTLTIEELSTKGIFEAAVVGDELGQMVVAKASEMLGRGLAMAADLINPEMIIIGGGVAKAGDDLFIPVREAFLRYALPRVVEAARIVPALLGNDAGVVGAGKLAF